MTPESFFRKQVPDEWNRRLDAQLALGDEGAELAGKMLAVSFSLEATVRGDGGGHFALRVRDGRMQPGDVSPEDRLAVLDMSYGEWERLAEEVGPSPLALLGGIGGSDEFVLTDGRLVQLRDVAGTFRLQITGADEWGLLIHFGPGDVPEEASTRIAIDAEEYRGLRDGTLDLQGAFMSGKLTLEGEVEAAMKLAMAFMSPA